MQTVMKVVMFFVNRLVLIPCIAVLILVVGIVNPEKVAKLVSGE